MKFFHISHNDLDGYSCHLVSSKYFPDGKFYNCNYGAEVSVAIKDVLGQIELTCQNDEVLFIISDLNPVHTECKELDNRLKALQSVGYNVKLQLLDHHITGQKSSQTFDWYFLDVARSAAKITYDYFYENYGPTADDARLAEIIDAVNSVDIWLENRPSFEFGKVLMRMISSANEINATLFKDRNRKYRLDLLEHAAKYINEENSHIILDNNIHFLKKELLLLSNGCDDTMDNLSAKRLVFMLKHYQELLTVYYGDFKGLLTFGLGSISIPANTFLKDNPDFSFFIDVGKKGNASFRASGVVDVSQMAAKIANGGGHKNASGGKFEGFSENFTYDDVKKFVQDKLNAKE